MLQALFPFLLRGCSLTPFPYRILVWKSVTSCMNLMYGCSLNPVSLHLPICPLVLPLFLLPKEVLLPLSHLCLSLFANKPSPFLCHGSLEHLLQAEELLESWFTCISRNRASLRAVILPKSEIYVCSCLPSPHSFFHFSFSQMHEAIHSHLQIIPNSTSWPW